MFVKEQRTALVTGAARGIGLASAQRLRRQGCKVVGVDIDADAMQVVIEHFDTVDTVDISDGSAVEALRDRLGQIDIIVNSAGIVGPNKPTWEISDDEWKQTIDINLGGTFHLMRAFVPAMVERGWGRIVNIASIAGKEGNPNLAAYSASKAAVIGLTKSIG